MRKTLLVAAVVAALPALAETWKNVPLVDSMCSQKVKANPDAHQASCALACAGSGYGILTADGTYLKLNDAGNQKAVAALKATKRHDHLRATVRGERSGDNIKVESLSLD